MSNTTRILLAIFLPPLAISDKGWDKILITTLLWFMVGPLGNIAAFYLGFDGAAYDRAKENIMGGRPTSRYMYDDDIETADEKRKRDTLTDEPSEYIELADGHVLEVINTEDEERRGRLEL